MVKRLNPQHVIVIGGSAGSIQALRELIGQFPPDLNAAVFVVVHLSRQVPSNLAVVLNRVSALPVDFVRDAQPIEAGRIYLAPPDFHLLLSQGQMRLVRGPFENRTRPAIDVLFRSAAVAYQSKVTGVILSGLLDDGTLGLQAIKRCGGVAAVQDPEEALFRSMPDSAIAYVAVDYVAPVAKLGRYLAECTQQQRPANQPVPEDLRLEVRMTEQVMGNAHKMERIGEAVAQSCPACGGPLWEIGQTPILQYRCHVGHSFTARALVETQDEATEEALWVALRTLEERGRLLERIGQESKFQSRSLAERYHTQAAETRRYAEQIRKLLYTMGQLDLDTAEKRN